MRCAVVEDDDLGGSRVQASSTRAHARGQGHGALMRLRRGVAIAAIAGAGAFTTMLVGLVTNAVSEQSQWPAWLGWIQQNAWLSFVLLGVTLVGLTALLATLSDVGAPGTGPEPLVRSEDDPGSPGAALVLRSLPRDTASFIDRTEELERLVTSVETAQRTGEPLPVHVIDGMPGVGKTTFAVHAGHLLAEHFPDGQLFVNLNGHTPGRNPVQASEALASLLAATGVPTQQLPVGDDTAAVTETWAAMWRGQLADRKALLILDNALSYQQFEPLLPGGRGCLVMVTSRKRLAAHEEVILPVEALPPDHAMTLFIKLSRRPAESFEQEGLAELVELCGYLPLGVALLATRLRHHPSWSMDDLRARLVAARDRLGEMRAGERAVAATFGLSYQDLPSERQRFFRRLGSFPGTDIDAYIGAALDSCPVAEARQHLDALYDDHLIDELPGSRYRLHDLLRDYAYGLAHEGDDMDGAQSVQRVCSYYLAALAGANVHLARGGASTRTPPDPDLPPATALPVLETRTAALDWLEDERSNVLACIDRASSLSLHTMTIRLASAMAPFLRQAGPWDQAVGLHRAAAEAARRSGDRLALADALAELGIVRRNMANYPAAIEALDEAVTHYDAVGGLRGKADALNQAGIVHYMTAENEAAVQAQTDALAIYRESGHRLGQANSLADLGMVRRQTSRFDASIEAQTEALSIYRELNDRYGQANSLRDLGVVHSLTGEYGLAARQHREAFDLYQALGDRVHQAYALNEIGVVRRLTGDSAGAREAHEQALEHYTEFGDQFGRANSIRFMGMLERLAGNSQDAAARAQEALLIYQDLGSRGGEGAALGELGAARGASGDASGASEAFEQSLRIMRELGFRSGEAEVLNHWGTMLRRTGDPAGGHTSFSQALLLAREIGCPLEQARALEGIGRCDIANGDTVTALSSLREALTVYERLGATETATAIEHLLQQQSG
jgi:tetratricopeptide (TPR) repeat protein